MQEKWAKICIFSTNFNKRDRDSCIFTTKIAFLYCFPWKLALISGNQVAYFKNAELLFEHGRREMNGMDAPCGAWSFQENSRRWPENLFQKIIIQVSLVRNCLEDSTMRNPVHTSETRMCGDENIYTFNCLDGSTSPIRYSLPGWLVDEDSISEGILSFVEYAPRFFPMVRRYAESSWCCLPGNNEQAKLEIKMIIHNDQIAPRRGKSS